MKAERLPPKYNDYEHLTDWMIKDTRYPYVLRIWCHQCGRNEVAPLGGGVHTVQQSLADKIFQRKGWMIGRKRKFDTCPDCVKRERDERNARRIEANAKSNPTIADIWPEKPSNVVPMPPPTADEPRMPVLHLSNPSPIQKDPCPSHIEPPREMSRADKRIIFNKLEEVYGDESSGYTSGWSDQRVATDLGVPLAWVHTIREDSFGPEGHSPEAKALFDETRKMLTEVRDLQQKFLAAYSEYIDRSAKLTGDLDRIERKLAQVEKGKL